MKKANLSTLHRPSTCAAIFFYLLTPPCFGALNRESESSGSQSVYRKLFPCGLHSSKNNFLGIKISRPTPWVSLSVLLWLLTLSMNIKQTRAFTVPLILRMLTSCALLACQQALRALWRRSGKRKKSLQLVK